MNPETQIHEMEKDMANLTNRVFELEVLIRTMREMLRQNPDADDVISKADKLVP